jgi:NAD(P)H-hydrate epimerase
VDFVKLVTGAGMAEVDRRTIAGGTPGAVLMERAGQEVFNVIAERWPDPAGMQAVVVCGGGNNGGDGFVVGRLLHRAGVQTRVFLAAARPAPEGDAGLHLRRLEGEEGVAVESAAAEKDLAALTAALADADLAVDALLGTGLSGSPRAEAARVIETLNRSGVPVIAVDLPSGLESGTGRVHGACVQAVVTVTFGLPKVGHLFYPGRARCGDLRLVEIGFSPEAVAAVEAPALLLTEDRMAGLIPVRPGDAHKGTCGSVAVVAGSLGMTGAAVLAAEAALATGAGRVTLGVPASLHDLVAAKVTEVMTRPLPEVRQRRCLALRGLGEVLALASGADCLALGPGLGRNRQTGELVRRLLPRVAAPLVLDADGLFALAGNTAVLKERRAPSVLTPHPGEFARLTGAAPGAIAEDPLGLAGRFALEHGVVLVLKGAPTVVAWPDGRRLVNPTGNAGMATAGAGDVLTGAIAGLIAQGVAPDLAACLGVFLHGRAGDLARDRLGEWGMVAGDLRRLLPQAILDTWTAGRGRPFGGGG